MNTQLETDSKLLINGEWLSPEMYQARYCKFDFKKMLDSLSRKQLDLLHEEIRKAVAVALAPRTIGRRMGAIYEYAAKLYRDSQTGVDHA